MTTRRTLVLFVAFLSLLLPATASLGASAPAQRSGSFQGIDGLYYDLSPSVVLGHKDEKFYGPDFDVACGYGDKLEAGMRQLSKLARMIERSGRRAIFTVAPNKSSVLTERVDPAQLPHGQCDALGLAQQEKLLDHYSDPSYLPIREKLHRDRTQTYWQTDLHWTSVGASVFTKALANELGPRLGRIQRYRTGTKTQLGGLNALMHNPAVETAPTATVKGGTEVSPRKVTADEIYDNTWRTDPRRYSWPGRTVVIGDSMMSMALYDLRPIFAHGRFMWLGHVSTADIARQIAKADTVVFETIQIFVPVNDLATRHFRSQVKHALRGS